MATFQAKTNRKQIAIILGLMRYDCIALYKQFGTIKTQLKSAIELYEEFMTNEVNTLFQCNTNFSDIVLKHREKFNKFVGEIVPQITDGFVSHTNGSVGSSGDGVYVLFISLQEWLTQGPKGQQFYFMIDIDSFNLTNLMKWPNPTNATHKTNDTGQPNEILIDKKAHIMATDFANQTFIAFDGDKLIDCDNSMRNDIKRVQYFLKIKGDTGILPTKCVYTLLEWIFYGVHLDEDFNSNAKIFTSHVTVSYEHKFNATSQTSRIEARNLTSMKALHSLCKVENQFIQRKRNYELPPHFADKIQELIINGFKQHAKIVNLDNKSNVLAGIVQSEGRNFKTIKVVVLATGTKNIDADALYEKNALPDTHAEVVARRCFMHYLYEQLDVLLKSETSHQSIFEQSSRDRRIKLKDDILFHLYISKGPCGDATTFGHAGKIHPDRGLLLAKVEKAVGNKRVIDLTEMQTGSKLHSNHPLYTITCSDKIARWNVVGIQGALLSRIIEPIYFDSIILGKPLPKDHIIHSFYGRIENSIGCLPRFYYHHKPNIAFTQSGRRNTHQQAPKLSYNWIANSDCVEEIESKSGKLTNRYQNNSRSIVSYGDISRLTKRKLFHKFLNIKQKLPNIDDNDGQRKMYADEKLLAEDYQAAKETCIDAFNRINLGNWKFVQKPQEIDRFYDGE